MALINLAVRAIFIENILLAFFWACARSWPCPSR